MYNNGKFRAVLRNCINAKALSLASRIASSPAMNFRCNLASNSSFVLKRMIVLFGLSVGYVGNATAECTTDELPSTDTVQSFEKVFDEVSRRWGQIIRADLTAQGIGNLCLWVYEIKLLSASGEVTNVVYDASKLRMIGFNSPQVAAEKPDPSVLRSIGQRFGFFGRRDPTSEGRGDSDRGEGDGQSSASSDNGNGTGTGTDSGSSNDTATDSGTADATDGAGGPTSGAATGADEGNGGSGQSGSSSGAGGSGSSSNSSGSTGSSGSSGG